MAEAAYLVSRTIDTASVNTTINGVQHVIINADDAQSDAAIATEAAALATRAYDDAAVAADSKAPPVFPSDYFDTVTAIDLTGAVFGADEQGVVLDPNDGTIAVAAPA